MTWEEAYYLLGLKVFKALSRSDRMYIVSPTQHVEILKLKCSGKISHGQAIQVLDILIRQNITKLGEVYWEKYGDHARRQEEKS